jgi:hypothetical protein
MPRSRMLRLRVLPLRFGVICSRVLRPRPVWPCVLRPRAFRFCAFFRFRVLRPRALHHPLPGAGRRPGRPRRQARSPRRLGRRRCAAESPTDGGRIPDGDRLGRPRLRARTSAQGGLRHPSPRHPAGGRGGPAGGYWQIGCLPKARLRSSAGSPSMRCDTGSGVSPTAAPLSLGAGTASTDRAAPNRPADTLPAGTPCFPSAQAPSRDERIIIPVLSQEAAALRIWRRIFYGRGWPLESCGQTRPTAAAVQVPLPGQTSEAYFDVRATHTGTCQVWVVVRQGPLTLLTLRLEAAATAEQPAGPTACGGCYGRMADGIGVLLRSV